MRSDAELLAAARSDAGAFRELYERYAARIYGYHLRRSQDAHAAHDLTAETFAQAWLARGRFRDEARGSAGPWLFGIARYVLLVSVRRRRLERSACERLGVLDAAGRERAPQPHDAWLGGLDEVLAHLPVAQRQAIRLRIVDDLGYEEAAERLETTPQAVRARVSRGLSALRKHFSDSSLELTP
jgi:RNA polymerase sigma factor (sigma-70 family)